MHRQLVEFIGDSLEEQIERIILINNNNFPTVKNEISLHFLLHYFYSS